MTLSSPGVILCQLGSVSVTWYAALTLAGFVIATACGVRLARKNGYDITLMLFVSVLTFMGALIGARLYYVCLTPAYYLAHPQDIISQWQYGRSIHGAVIGTLASLVACSPFSKFGFLASCDIAGACLPLGQAIGRWGNFFNSEAFGLPVSADFPLKLFIPGPSRGTYTSYEYFHPTFLYESIWDLSIFAVLYFFLWPKMKQVPGACFLSYVFLYSVGRLIIEPLRRDSIMLGSWPAASVASAVSLLLSAVGLMVLFRRKVEKNQASKPVVSTAAGNHS